MTNARPFAVALLALAACDTPATPSAGGVAAPTRTSAALESCAATADCADGLRCLDQVCRAAARSLAGDYAAALADRARAAGELPAAVAAYADAVARYEADKLAVPIELECAHGAALVEARGDRERAELAARVLHRCVRGAPAGSALAAAGLRALAALDEQGFDPAHLAREQPADKYLTRTPAAPRADQVQVTLAAEPPLRHRLAQEALDALAAAPAPLRACWDASFAATRQPVLEAAVPLRTTYKDSGYDDEPGTWTLAPDAKAPAAAGPAEACVRDAVAAALGAPGRAGAEWSGVVRVVIR